VEVTHGGELALTKGEANRLIYMIDEELGREHLDMYDLEGLVDKLLIITSQSDQEG